MEEQCLVCSSVVKDVIELSRHYHEQHPLIIFACYACDKSVDKLDLLNLHLNQEHSITNPDQSKIALYDTGQIVKGCRGASSVGFLDGSISEPEVKMPKKRKRSGSTLLGGNQRCVVDGCSSTCHTPGVKLFRFPSKNLHQRYLWVALLNKKTKDGAPFMAKPFHRICSLHFKDRKHSKKQTEENFIPTLFMDPLEEGASFQQDTPAPEVILNFVFIQ